MAELPNPVGADLSRGFTVAQVVEKHNWTEPMVWSLALKDKEDIDRFKELGWGLRTWDQWEWNDCDKRFGDDWPGRIPAQLIARIHTLTGYSAHADQATLVNWVKSMPTPPKKITLVHGEPKARKALSQALTLKPLNPKT